MNEPGIKTRSYCRYSAETFPEIARVPKRKPGCKNKGKRRLFIFLGRKEEVQQEINLMSFVFLGWSTYKRVSHYVLPWKCKGSNRGACTPQQLTPCLFVIPRRNESWTQPWKISIILVRINNIYNCVQYCTLIQPCSARQASGSAQIIQYGFPLDPMKLLLYIFHFYNLFLLSGVFLTVSFLLQQFNCSRTPAAASQVCKTRTAVVAAAAAVAFCCCFVD